MLLHFTLTSLESSHPQRKRSLLASWGVPPICARRGSDTASRETIHYCGSVRHADASRSLFLISGAFIPSAHWATTEVWKLTPEKRLAIGQLWSSRLATSVQEVDHDAAWELKLDSLSKNPSKSKVDIVPDMPSLSQTQCCFVLPTWNRCTVTALAGMNMVPSGPSLPWKPSKFSKIRHEDYVLILMRASRLDTLHGMYIVSILFIILSDIYIYIELYIIATCIW